MSRWVSHKSHAPFDVYVGRPSVWGNPFSHKPDTLAKFKVATREESIARHREWFLSQPELVARAKAELRGKVLGCWCAPSTCHADVIAEVANSEAPRVPALPRVVDHKGTTVICLDTEYDARYSDRGVSRLACMTYSIDGGPAKIVGYTDAVELWVGWARDPSVVFLGHSLYHDLATLADEAHLHFEGELSEAPGVGPYWELAHALYDSRRVADTEIRQRLTYVRFGPHKASVQLGMLAKHVLGIDVGDSKNVPDEARVLLADAVPYEDWPADTYAQTPCRVKFGHLRELYGNDVSKYPREAVDYALKDARLPQQLFAHQRARWGRPIPNLHEQYLASWVLHMVAIPGWLADRERAQGLRTIYSKTIEHCERTLLAAGVLEIDGPRAVKKMDKIKALVFAALGEDTPISKTAAASLSSPTLDQRREFATTDAKACTKAIKALGGPVLGTTPKKAAASFDAALADLVATKTALSSTATWATLYAHWLRGKTQAALAKPDEAQSGACVSELDYACEAVLIEAGVREIVTNRPCAHAGRADHDTSTGTGARRTIARRSSCTTKS